MTRLTILLVTCIATLAFASEPDVSLPQAWLKHASDYTFGYYPYGWRAGHDGRPIVYAVRTNHYVMVVNASAGKVTRFGVSPSGFDALTAAAEDNTVLDTLPTMDMTFSAMVDGKRFRLVSGAPKPEDVRLQRVGRYLQHFEIHGVTLKADDGTALDGAAVVEFYAWPKFFLVNLHWTPERDGDAVLEISVAPRDGMALVNPLDGGTLRDRTSATAMAKGPAVKGERRTVSLAVAPKEGLTPRPSEANRLQAKGIAPYTKPLVVTYEPTKGWYDIRLGENPDQWTMERVRVTVAPLEFPTSLRLNFSKLGGAYSITGMSPMIRTTDGLPLGLPVQISKNWHVNPSWFSGITILSVPANTPLEFEFSLAYAEWGGVPAASHAQLALEGWGTHQLWDQMAIGSFGESITYDPDINLNRSMIDDVRPLMLWGMGQREKAKWGWTHNVGGGDFLVLFQNGKRQYLTRQKAWYQSYGPVLTEVWYVGECANGAIQSRIKTQSWRSDDYVRGLHAFRYDVVAPVDAFERLAFYQLGADHYNTNLFRSAAVGHAAGCTERWAPVMGGKTYSRQGLPLKGDQPWVALYDSEKNPPPFIKEGDQGAWADRAMIVRRWKARLNGMDVGVPHYSVYGSEDGGIPSALVELSPPSGVTRLLPGDYVEAQVEMVVLPQRVEDYYGPNEDLRTFLETRPEGWRLAHREAAHGSMTTSVSLGHLEQASPPRIRAAGGTRAEFSLQGGFGYRPITITGAATPGPFKLERVGDDGREVIDQSSAGSDWWQADFDPATQSWSLSFTLPMEGPVRRFVWSSP